MDVGKLLSAVIFAVRAHNGQCRKNEMGYPYVVHPIEASEILAFHGITDTDILVAAVLHDVLEDTKVSEDEIQYLFGPRVLSIVKEVTDDKGLTREERHAAQIEKAPKLSHAAALVKLADKISNLSSISNEGAPKNWTREYTQAYKDHAKAVVDAGLRRGDFSLARVFDRVYAREIK